MRFLLDESADFPLAAFLRELGHDVTSIAHDYPSALKDHEILEIALREARVHITNDTDFGELVVRRRLPHSGIILFRLRNEELSIKQARLVHALDHYADQMQHLLVITQRGIRVRHPPA